MQNEQETDGEVRQSTAHLDKERLALMESHLLKANHLHDVDLIKTQVSFSDNLPDDASILVLIKYPEFSSITSCRYSTFLPGRIRLTLEQLESTGSELLMGLLHDERHQRRARRAAAPLEAGVTHVLDLSPSYDEEDSTIALQRLTITEGIKLWYRSMAFGVSPLVSPTWQFHAFSTCLVTNVAFRPLLPMTMSATAPCRSTKSTLSQCLSSLQKSWTSVARSASSISRSGLWTSTTTSRTSARPDGPHVPSASSDRLPNQLGKRTSSSIRRPGCGPSWACSASWR